MLTQDNATVVAELLAAADREFADGEPLKGSELMWKATKQAMTAVARQRNWPCDSDDDLGEAARLLDKEYGDRLTLLTKFGIAETFQYNATADILKDFEIEPCRESVVSLIDYLLQQAEPLTGQG
jgi:hypothetical protein